jgi:uncharacterized membrane protein
MGGRANWCDDQLMRTRNRIAWGLLVVFSLLMTMLAVRYLTFDPDVYFEQQRTVYTDNTVPLIGHVVGGSVAMLLGPIQLLPRLRRRWPGAHRLIGRLYFGGIFVGGAFGLWMAFLAFGGVVSTVGFAALAVAWLVTGARALSTIRQGDVAAHRRWTTRNLALTFAAVTLRLWLPALDAAGLEFVDAYRAVAWLSWVPNLALAEWIVRTRLQPSTPKVISTSAPWSVPARG